MLLFTTPSLVLLLVLMMVNDLTVSLKLSMMSEKIAICLFTPGSIMRYNNNPCFQYAEAENMLVSPILIEDNIDFAKDYKDFDHICNNLSNKISKSGGNLIRIKGNMIQSLKNHIDNLKKDDNISSSQINLLYINSFIDPLKSSFEQIKQSSLDVNIIQLEDNLVNSQVFNSEMVESSSDLTNFLFTKYEKKLYSNLEKRIPKPKDSTIKYYNSNSNSNNNYYIDTLCGEDLGEKLLKEYLLLGDRDFTYKYKDQYINTISTSEDHKMSLNCLNRRDPIWGGSRDTSYFQGEVLSGLINPLISLGCLSPSLLIHAKSLFNARERIGLEVPLYNRIKIEAIRKDWHKNLALLSSNANNNNIKEKDWKIKYTYFKGYLQREGTMMDDESSSSIEKPLIFLIHGFGGSLNQMTSLAQNLAEDFDVAAIDMLGFGHTEKPPLSYNQYFWRDQIVAYVKKVSNGRKNKNVFLMGNSIGGFIVTAAAATLSMEYAKNSAGILPAGLVLCNSAGDLASDLEGIVIDDLFKTYQGPPSEFLRIFGKVIFSLLQPNIEKTCEWLYPSNIKPVKDLAKNILRDSEDPGASDVIAAGGKLPTPEPMSSLFDKFKGPALIAQGASDPLNDAKDRARQFGEIREDIFVDLMELGHCPFHENPILIAGSIKRWISDKKICKTVVVDNVLV